MNVLDNSAIRECTSCQVCAVLCTHNAIKIELDSDGFYRPIIDTDLCTNCGLCTKVCYKFDNNIKLTSNEQLNKSKLYAAWSNDDELVKNTTSGGIGDLLACKLQKKGYKTVGCIYNEEKVRAEHRIAKTEKECSLFRGSKYIQSYTYDALKEVVSNCKSEKYAIFGTPCQIYGLNKLASLKKVQDNFFFVDLYCHGCPSIHAWTKYHQYIKEKLKTKRISNIVFRSKVRGWGVYCILAKSHENSIFKSGTFDNSFYELFFSDEILNGACNSCLLRSTHEYTDIRLGDFWGKKFLNNQRGVSAVSVVSKKGACLFEEIKKMDVFTSQCEYNEFLPFQSWGKIHNPNKKTRDAILSSLKNDNHSIKDTIKVYHRSQSIKRKIKRYIKTVLSLFPLCITNMIKKVI